MTNYKPHADARDQAFWSRACLIEFGVRFVAHPHALSERQADPALKDKLRQERSGILAWLVRGCLAWQQQGLAIPTAISLATEKYRDEEDRILQFLTERCVMQPDASIKAGVLYEAYKAWCEENQFGRGMNATLFGNEIGKRFEKKRITAGMIYEGIGLLSSSGSNGGSMYTSPSPTRAEETASEANPQQSKATEHVGYVGFRQVFPDMQKKGSYEGQNLAKPYIPYISPSAEITSEPASEADADPKNIDKQPYIDPTCASKPQDEWEEFVL